MPQVEVMPPGEDGARALDPELAGFRVQGRWPAHCQMAWQYRIVGNTLSAWLKQRLPDLLQERAFFQKLTNWDPHPLIAFGSNVPGLLAARIITGPGRERFVYLPHDVIETAPPLVGETEYMYHMHHWSYVSDVLEPALLDEARRRYPIPETSRYWLHHEGVVWGQNCGGGEASLVEWDGETPRLLESDFVSWNA